MNFFSAILGRERFFVEEKDLTALWNLFLSKRFSFSEFSFEEGGASFWALAIDARKFCASAEQAGIRLVKKEKRGFVALFYRYRFRW